MLRKMFFSYYSITFILCFLFKDNLLVFYIPNSGVVNEAVIRLQKLGNYPVPPENPYWNDKGLTFEDPDGWRVVLFSGTWE